MASIRTLIPMALLLLSSAAFAGTTTYQIEGMTCGNCVKSVKKEVCSLPGITKCEVDVGSMKLTTPDGQSIDETVLKTAVEKAGYNLTGKAK